MADPLDTLYGANSSRAFTKALDNLGANTTVQVMLPNGNVRVNTLWTDGGEMKVECSPTNVHYLTLKSVPNQDRYTLLCDSLPGMMKQRGVQTFTCTPGSIESRDVLMTRGAWVPVGGNLRWVL